MTPDNAAEQLAALAAKCERRRLLIAPSTTATRALTDLWRSQACGHLAFVAPLWGKPVAELLRDLDAGAPPDVIVVFSDQLTSAIDAPVRVVMGADDTFLPALEIRLAQDFDYEIWAWSADGFVRIDQEACSILGALLALHAACEGRSKDWLARDAQFERQPSHRSIDARQRVRLLQSALMAAAAEGRIRIDAYRAVLARLEQLHRSPALRKMS
ncbi:hypothetical protein AB4059_04360 [Lysobacter sp. 2RAF19]